MSKKPFVTKEQVEEIVKTYPTPFHLYDEKGIRANAKALKEAFSWNPGYKEYFAVKATPNPFLLDILKEYGCGCDCSSYTELMLSGICPIALSRNSIWLISSRLMIAPSLSARRKSSAGVSFDENIILCPVTPTASESISSV